MHRKLKVISLVFALIFISGAVAFSVNAMNIDAEIDTTQVEMEAEAEEKYDELIERGEELEKIFDDENLSGEELNSAIEEDSEWRTDLAEYYVQYGWDKFDGVVYDRETLLQLAEENIIILKEIIAQIEQDYIENTEGPTREEFIAFYENRIKLNEEFIIKVQNSDDTNLQALSGEYENMYFLGDIE